MWRAPIGSISSLQGRPCLCGPGAKGEANRPYRLGSAEADRHRAPREKGGEGKLAEPLAERILHLIDQAGDLYYRLILVVAPPGAGKTTALREAASRTGAHYVNANLEVSRQLLELTERQRSVAVPRLLDEALGQGGDDVWLLDNIEILFDVSLKLDPLRLLQKLSRNRTLVVAWNGCLQEGYLTYAAPEHAEYRRYAARDLVIISAVPASDCVQGPSPEGGSDEVQ